MMQKKHLCMECGSINMQVAKEDDFHCSSCDAAYSLADVVLWPYEDDKERMEAIRLYCADVMGVEVPK